MSILSTALTADTAVAAGGTVPFGSAVHGYGKAIRLNGNAISLYGTGYYLVNISLTALVTGATALTASLQSNGNTISGAEASAVPAAAGDAVNLSITWLIRKGCCAEPTTLTVVLDSAATVTDMMATVEKVA